MNPSFSKQQKSYELLDSGGFLKLERVGEFTLVRPAPQALWKPASDKKNWESADARFLREGPNHGRWIKHNKKMPDEWKILIDGKTFWVRLTDFGHIGLFPEHHDFESLKSVVTDRLKQKKDFLLLNLFAYTGALSVVAQSFGAKVVHLDASKKSVQWAKDNEALNNSGSKESHIRWIVDDVRKFVKRELKRQVLYDGIILDPPSFGRDGQGKVWKIEEDLSPLLEDLNHITSPDFSYLALTCHTPGYTPVVLKNLVVESFPKLDEKKMICKEMLIEEKLTGRMLPSGAACQWRRS